MASFKPNLKHTLGLITSTLALVSPPSLAQLPELPPAPPAPPASPAETSPPASPSAPSAPAPEHPSPDSPYLRPQASCPQNFETLSDLLIRDIPSYTNRILQSSVADISTAYRPTYVITASRPERMPLEITDRVYTTPSDSSEDLHQLFFTTLERQYSGLDTVAIEHFHWLFLAPDENGWQMVFMFSAIEAEDGAQIPPRDSSQGSVGQAVRRWLTDCAADAVLVE